LFEAKPVRDLYKTNVQVTCFRTTSNFVIFENDKFAVCLPLFYYYFFYIFPLGLRLGLLVLLPLVGPFYRPPIVDKLIRNCLQLKRCNTKQTAPFKCRGAIEPF